MPAPPEDTASPIVRQTPQAQNGVIQLPNFIVGEPRVSIPSPMEVLTPKGRVELAFARWPGLRLVPLAWMNEPIAVAMLEDELQAQRGRQAADLLSLYAIR